MLDPWSIWRPITPRPGTAAPSCIFVRKDIERALGDLRRALALDPNHFKALDGLAQILREIGQKKPALKAFRQLLDIHPYWAGAKQAVDELERDVDGQGI